MHFIQHEHTIRPILSAIFAEMIVERNSNKNAVLSTCSFNLLPEIEVDINCDSNKLNFKIRIVALYNIETQKYLIAQELLKRINFKRLNYFLKTLLHVRNFFK